MKDKNSQVSSPVVVAICLALSTACIIQAAAVSHFSAAGQSTGTDSHLVHVLITDPMIHLVAVPAYFFIAYATIQLLAYSSELKQQQFNRLPNTRITSTAGHTYSNNTRELAEAPDKYLTRKLSADQQLSRPIEFGVGALTMLGLLGTIFGLSMALGDLPAVMQESSTPEDKTVVLESLGFAFTTTIVGIVGSLAVSFIWMLCQQKSQAIDDLLKQPTSPRE